MYAQPPLLSRRQMLILLDMHKNGNKIKFKEQNYFKSNRRFKQSMKQLCNAGYLKIRKTNGNHPFNEYLLTLDGIFIVEDVLNHFIKCNQKD